MTMAAPMHVVLRVDASPAIGLGHAMRCLSLAEALRSAGHTVGLCSVAMPDALRQRYAALGVHETRIDGQAGSADDAHATADVVRRSDAAWLVGDGYALETAWQRMVRTLDTCVLMLDDEARLPSWDADIILNQNLGADAAMYAHRAAQARVLCGADYALLRSEFTAQRAVTRRVAEQARKVLVTMGGADPDNVTERVLHAVLPVNDLEVRVLVGAANPHGEMLAQVITEVAASTTRARLIVQASDVPAQMSWADLAISAGGSTLWELALMQLPSLVVQTADNQRIALGAYVSAGAAWLLGPATSLDQEVMRARFKTLAADRDARQAMARAASGLVDGNGSTRVVRAMEQIA